MSAIVGPLYAGALGEAARIFDDGPHPPLADFDRLIAAFGHGIASRGQARRLGERGFGHLDPGAASAALILDALAEAAASPRGAAP